MKKITQDVAVEREAADCQCGAPLPVHLLWALRSHHCSCGRVWLPNNERTAFIPKR